MRRDQIDIRGDGSIVIRGRVDGQPREYALHCRIERSDGRPAPGSLGGWMHGSVGDLLPAREHPSRSAAEAYVREHLERYGAGAVIHRDHCANRPPDPPDPPEAPDPCVRDSTTCGAGAAHMGGMVSHGPGSGARRSLRGDGQMELPW